MNHHQPPFSRIAIRPRWNACCGISFFVTSGLRGRTLFVLVLDRCVSECVCMQYVPVCVEREVAHQLATSHRPVMSRSTTTYVALNDNTPS